MRSARRPGVRDSRWDPRRASAVARALALTLALALTPAVRAANPAPDTVVDPATTPLAGSPGAATAATPAPPADPASAAAVAAADDIRDIRGPKWVMPPWLLPALAAGVLLLAAIGYGLWRWTQWRRRPRPLLPFEITLQRLEALRPLMQPATVREYSSAISDIVRAHIEQGFDVTATHLTTEEFLHDLLHTANASLAAHRSLLAEFLQRCDEAKFAGVSLSALIMESLLQSARSFVIETSKPSPPPASTVSRDSLPAT